MSLHVGTSGWAFKEWKPDFYPAGLPQTRWLEHYCTLLTACEVNATFYRMQTDTTFVKWNSAAPESFRFAFKAHRKITHSRELVPDSEQRSFIGWFLESVSIVGPRLGAVLYQFPKFRERDDVALKAFLTALPPGAPFAIEFVSVSWTSSDVESLVAEFGGTVCVTDRQGEPPQTLPEGPIGYVRLRNQAYTDTQRDAWRHLLEREAANRHVLAFAKHEGIDPRDQHGGLGLARWLVDLAR